MNPMMAAAGSADEWKQDGCLPRVGFTDRDPVDLSREPMPDHLSKSSITALHAQPMAAE